MPKTPTGLATHNVTINEILSMTRLFWISLSFLSLSRSGFITSATIQHGPLPKIDPTADLALPTTSYFLEYITFTRSESLASGVHIDGLVPILE